MPELPEVETMRRGIQPVVGARIQAVERVRCSRKPIVIYPGLPKLQRRMVGQRIVATDRAGKRVVVRLESGDALVIEPRMTGLVLLTEPPTREHLRLRIELAGAKGTPELLYWDRRGLGLVRLLDPAEFDHWHGPGKLGPDALALSPELLRERFGESRRAIKVALLDQRAVAGIGNLYASEILHLAGLHPGLRCDKLSGDDWSLLDAAVRDVLSAAIRHEGSTLSDGTYRNALNQAGGYQNHHRVYSRAGKTCPVCRTAAIERVVQAQRSTFFCGQCQPVRRRAMAAASVAATSR
jgi:formamidopyrimidine-DNA glycosylase